MSSPKALDLFAGSGGLSTGLEWAGFDVVSAIERDEWAAETYRTNHARTVLIADDIKNYTDSFFKMNFSGIDLVAGGPPCQGYSVSGKRQYGIYKQENFLVNDFIRIVKIVQPKIFILENVRGLASATMEGRTKVLEHILCELIESGYFVYNKIIQAADFGIPQYRTRIIIIGSKSKLSHPFPDPTHGGPLKGHLGVMHAISDLPLVNAGEGSETLTPYPGKAENSFQKRMRKGCTGVFNHVAMKHSQRLVERFSQIPPGGKGYDMGRKGCENPQVTVYKSNNQRLVSHLPSLCITANFQSTYIHPVLNRNLTAREAARIMTFPDRYVFCGKRTLMSSSLLHKEGRHQENHLSQYNQIGNAVPPVLAELIANHLLEQIHL